MPSYQKLVRDNIPDIIRSNGEDPIVEVLSLKKYRMCLKVKLLEEVTELIEAPIEEIPGEASDILEVTLAILTSWNLSKEMIDLSQIENKESLISLKAELQEIAHQLQKRMKSETIKKFLSVLYSILLQMEITKPMIETIRLEKQKKNGAFEKRYFLKDVRKLG